MKFRGASVGVGSLVALALLGGIAYGQAPASSGDAEGAAASRELNADGLLQSVIEQLPREPLAISGSLTSRRQRGVVVGQYLFDLLTEWGGSPSRVRYTIRDSFGNSLEQLTLVRESASKTRYMYLAGSPLRPAGEPDLFGPIQKTDVCWIDLTLSFLWWRGSRVVGEESVRGHECYVVDVPAPAAVGGEAGDVHAPYTRARLWIDKELHMLLQAEGFDAAGEAVRRLWVKGFKKIDDRWMIKEMEIQSYPVVHRTKLTIDDVKPVESPARDR